MKNHSDRVLAYRAATLIENEELANIGGGSGMSSHACSRQSGSNGYWDVSIDITFDIE